MSAAPPSAAAAATVATQAAAFRVFLVQNGFTQTMVAFEGELRALAAAAEAAAAAAADAPRPDASSGNVDAQPEEIPVEEEDEDVVVAVAADEAAKVESPSPMASSTQIAAPPPSLMASGVEPNSATTRQLVPSVDQHDFREASASPTGGKYGVITVEGSPTALWELDDAEPMAPAFPNGAGFPLQVFEATARDEDVELVPCVPYLKEPPPTGLPLESFDLRVIYEAGRTGFEEAKDFPIVPNTVIAGRYQILQYLDSAAFSRAVKCLDLKHQHEVCIKVIRNSKDFFDQSLDEIKLLQYINAAGDADAHCVLQLYDFFYFKEHIFIVCELLRDNLYEFGKYNREHETEPYFTLARVQAIARQVLTGLSFIHDMKLLHCDLKPENILIKSYSRCEVRVIDFGSSCFTTDNLSSYIQSRCYRAPEVILGCHYDGRIDVWSLGAILPELMTGNVMFHNKTVVGMLARIAGVCGPFPERMLHEGRHTCRFVSKTGAFYETKESTGDVEYYFPLTAPLAHLNLGTDDPLFRDFIRQSLTVDYTKRPTAKELLQHPFLQQDYGAVYSAPPPRKKSTA